VTLVVYQSTIVCLSTSMMLNISATKRFRGSLQ